MPSTSGTYACPPMMPSVPTSSDTRVTSRASVDRRDTIWFTVVFSSSISPCTSTCTIFDRSPRATAFVTSAIERTWFVKFMAIRLTLSVKTLER